MIKGLVLALLVPVIVCGQTRVPPAIQTIIDTRQHRWGFRLGPWSKKEVEGLGQGASTEAITSAVRALARALAGAQGIAGRALDFGRAQRRRRRATAGRPARGSLAPARRPVARESGSAPRRAVGSRGARRAGGYGGRRGGGVCVARRRRLPRISSARRSRHRSGGRAGGIGHRCAQFVRARGAPVPRQEAVRRSSPPLRCWSWHHEPLGAQVSGTVDLSASDIRYDLFPIIHGTRRFSDPRRSTGAGRPYAARGTALRFERGGWLVNTRDLHGSLVGTTFTPALGPFRLEVGADLGSQPVSHPPHL